MQVPAELSHNAQLMSYCLRLIALSGFLISDSQILLIYCKIIQIYMAKTMGNSGKPHPALSNAPKS